MARHPSPEALYGPGDAVQLIKETLTESERGALECAAPTPFV
jgi:hypothetical protein